MHFKTIVNPFVDRLILSCFRNSVTFYEKSPEACFSHMHFYAKVDACYTKRTCFAGSILILYVVVRIFLIVYVPLYISPVYTWQ